MALGRKRLHRGLYLFLGLSVAAGSSCASAGLFVVGFEPATHPQSPIRSWTIPPGGVVRETLDVDLHGYAKRDLDIELARYSAPYRREPIACKLHVSVAGRSQVMTDEATATSAGFCQVTVHDAAPAHVALDAENLSREEVSLSVAPALPGFPSWIKWSWLALFVVGACGLAGGIALFRSSARTAR